MWKFSKGRKYTRKLASLTWDKVSIINMRKRNNVQLKSKG